MLCGMIPRAHRGLLYQFRELCLLDRATSVAHFDQPAFAWR